MGIWDFLMRRKPLFCALSALFLLVGLSNAMTGYLRAALPPEKPALATRISVKIASEPTPDQILAAVLFLGY